MHDESEGFNCVVGVWKKVKFCKAVELVQGGFTLSRTTKASNSYTATFFWDFPNLLISPVLPPKRCLQPQDTIRPCSQLLPSLL